MWFTGKFYRLSLISLSCFLFLISPIMGGVKPSQLDIYDASDNHLMFITFQYDENGRNIGREVFMSDSTFIRRVEISYGDDGRRAKEASFNFNDDTSWVMKYGGSGKEVEFSISDQFGVDQVGGAVRYSAGEEQLSYDLTYKSNGGFAARIEYEKDGNGNLKMVRVYDKSGELQYYGLFDGVGVRDVGRGGWKDRKVLTEAVIRSRGIRSVDLLLRLDRGGEVRCDLMTVSGRYAATLYRGKKEAGSHEMTLGIGGKEMRGLGRGVYVLVVKIDGKSVYSGRYLHEVR